MEYHLFFDELEGLHIYVAIDFPPIVGMFLESGTGEPGRYVFQERKKSTM